MKYEWSNSLSIGYDLIDRQHQRLFDIANTLTDELGKSAEANKESLLSIIEDLLAYTRYHFAEEEPLMQQAGYPDFKRHKAIHDALIAKICTLEAQMRLGAVQEVAEVLPRLIGDWLVEHIAREDRHYSSYVQPYPVTEGHPAS